MQLDVFENSIHSVYGALSLVTNSEFAELKIVKNELCWEFNLQFFGDFFEFFCDGLPGRFGHLKISTIEISARLSSAKLLKKWKNSLILILKNELCWEFNLQFFGDFFEFFVIV